jgi:hypothetical protein
MAETVCQFCGAPPKQVWRDEVIVFECGARPHNLRPGTMACWAGFVWKLQERIAALEAAVMKKKPRTVREVAVAGGWHPEVKG